MKRFLTVLVALLSVGIVSVLAQGVVDPATANASLFTELLDGIKNFLNTTAFAHLDYRNLIMIVVGFIYVMLAIFKGFEPLLLVPIGFGVIVGNVPGAEAIGVYAEEQGSVLYYLYQGVKLGIYPPLVFLGIGAMTDFSNLIANPKLMILGAAAQIGIFSTFAGALYLGFSPQEAGSIGIIGGADGPTAIYVTGILAPKYLGSIAIAAYSYMALVPIIQPPLMRLLIPKKERAIRMKPSRVVTQKEKIMFPIIAFIICSFIAPDAIPLLGTLFLGNLLKESGVTKRLSDVAANAMNSSVVILLGFTVGASTQASVFLTEESIKIFFLGACAFCIATSCGLLFARLMNLFLSKDHKINPLIGSAGVSAVPMAARLSEVEGLKTDPKNHLLMHAMAPNVAGVIGSAIAAGVLLSFLR
ncbi:MAG: sodium ion-translocating decarboxylase subunit beta [Flavobacteriales bacterium]|nr:sodium ion-translocating decarboxylase subunit beta [Flavobacteriales bacterium]